MPFLKRSYVLSAAGLLILFLSACSGDGDFIQPLPDENDEGPRGINITRLLSGEQRAATESSLPVNSYIWRATLDTVDVLPIVSADPFTGVIATDWGSSNAATRERFRVTIMITSMELAVDSLRVTAFRQIRSGAVWQDAPIDPEVIRQIEDTILLRARELRIAENS